MTLRQRPHRIPPHRRGRPRCRWCGGLAVAGSVCPWSVRCPTCGAGPGLECHRPSGHRARMHAPRYRLTEAEDLAAGIVYPERKT